MLLSAIVLGEPAAEAAHRVGQPLICRTVGHYAQARLAGHCVLGLRSEGTLADRGLRG
jgi:hypothetical protein